ncbi:MAG: hypothetical protein FIB06_11605 [Betaproteobacteria bacterium]|nr:hypothetical protein [Betaproteobacteria bacterium]
MTGACPCGSGRTYPDCCGRLHAGAENAPDAESLMRSRYSAYVFGLAPYLLATWHASTRPESLDLSGEAAVKWLGLEIRRSELGDPAHACVEFVARWREGGRGRRLHESSRFVRDAGRWYYVDGEVALR